MKEIYSFSLLLTAIWILFYLVLTRIEAAVARPAAPYRTYPTLLHQRRRRSSTRHQNGHLNNVRVLLEVHNRKYTVILTLNRFIQNSSYVEKTYDARGRAVYHRPSLQQQEQSHCYYHGHVLREPGSLAAVSTCSGIRGVLVLRDVTYYVEPESSSPGGAHLVYTDEHLPRAGVRSCGHRSNRSRSEASKFEVPLREEFHSRVRRSAPLPYHVTSKTRIIELWVTNDFRQLYRPLDIMVAQVGAEIWTEKDLIPVTKNADDTMNNFLEYRKKNISPLHPNDNAQLITGHAFTDGVVGKALKGVICSFQYSGGVNMDHSPLVGPVATTVAHEIGHNLGMEHDTDDCACADSRCIMAASSGGKNPVRWSSCSKKQLADSFFQGMDYCLRNVPDSLFRGPVCGNGFVEAGEQCDCGTRQACDTPCCDAPTCRLTTNATCAAGACCDLKTCKLKAAATPCRPAAGECDLGEYCSGQRATCPTDVHLKDGTTCTQGYCYAGRCPSHAAQCHTLWGPSAVRAHRLCYVHFNKLGSDHGNCGYNWVTGLFSKCADSDVMCGMLHCYHRNEKLNFWKEALAKYMPEGWVTVNMTRLHCKGTILDVGLDSPDPGMVPDGSVCETEKVCVKQRCVPVTSLDKVTCPDCQGHGRCSSRGQCHCDAGWAPPYCDKAGDGGSLHSGPIKILKPNQALLVSMLVLFLLVLPLAAALGYLAFRHRERLKKLWNNQPSTKYHFLYRAKPASATAAAPPPRPVTSPACAPGPAVTRGSSFRDLPISSPRLDDTSYSAPLHSLTRSRDPQRRASDVDRTSRDCDKPMPSRPAPRRPNSLRISGQGGAPRPARPAPARPVPPMFSRGSRDSDCARAEPAGRAYVNVNGATSYYANVPEGGEEPGGARRYQNVTSEPGPPALPPKPEVSRKPVPAPKPRVSNC